LLTNANYIAENDLADFIAETDGQFPAYWISTSLKEALEKFGSASGQVLHMPSIMAIAKLFKTNHLEVHDAFQHLRTQGYDYNLVGMDAPIPFWYTRACDEEGSNP
jgi:hypothetical protein